MNVYIEASFTIKSTGEHKTIEVKINEDLIPFGVAKFLPRRCGETPNLASSQKVKDEYSCKFKRIQH